MTRIIPAVMFLNLLVLTTVISCSAGGGQGTRAQVMDTQASMPVAISEGIQATEQATEQVKDSSLETESDAGVDTQKPALPLRVLKVVCRDEWGARPPKGKYVRHEIARITVHHQGVVFKDAKRAPARLKTMQRYHQGEKKGFVDISYHFVVDPDGNIYEGRPTWARGETRTDYDTTGHLLVCLLGDFDKQEPAEAQVIALADVLAWASGAFHVDAEMIAGHKDHARTLCPGKNLHRLIADGTLRRKVDALLEAGGVERVSNCPVPLN
ncbi:MAG: hypothetical protein GY854_32765 [Deltaproteobacteria bacterium]|nr:hypothetical protein [Deltaproteobacteria bacterium]